MARGKKVEIIKTIVIDASVVSRWYLDEEWTDFAIDLRSDYQGGKLRLIAPYLLYYEVGNALRFSKDLTQADIIDALKALLKTQINIIFFDEDLIGKITEIAFLNNITVYDSSYCAIAEEYGYKFITGDESLKKKVNKPYFFSLKDYEFNKI
ncbi:MAG: type II toxin-antitoxin system VapC family toxin [Candidatus Helarchaeota archaeon]|nr:type II toxin-antitoxin system VapC family toxin [Candidatus Helarchaeota archaeon]